MLSWYVSVFRESDLATVRTHRNQLCDWLGVARPQMIAKVATVSVGRCKQQTFHVLLLPCWTEVTLTTLFHQQSPIQVSWSHVAANHVGGQHAVRIKNGSSKAALYQMVSPSAKKQHMELITIWQFYMTINGWKTSVISTRFFFLFFLFWLVHQFKNSAINQKKSSTQSITCTHFIYCSEHH